MNGCDWHSVLLLCDAGLRQVRLHFAHVQQAALPAAGAGPGLLDLRYGYLLHPGLPVPGAVPGLGCLRYVSECPGLA